MDDDELIKEISKNDEEGIIKTLGEEPISCQKKIIMGTIAGILLSILIIVIILLSNTERNSQNVSYGTLQCKYFIQTTKKATQIISKEFPQSGIEIYIKGNKIPFTREYTLGK